MNFGEKIQKLRKEKGWSQTELAKRIGVHLGHISRIEHGKTIPSIDVLKRTCAALEVSADFLLDDNADDATPVEIRDKTTSEKMKMIDDLPDKDRETIVHIIETMLTKKKIQDFISNEVKLDAA